MRHARFVHLGACVALLAATARAQVGAPLLGYLPEGGHILPVHGVAASASVSPALDFGTEFLHVAISPRQDFALTDSLGAGSVLVARPSGTTTAVPGTSAFPSSIAFSPSGSAAVLWFASSHHLEIVSGLPDTPVVRSVDAGFLSGSSSSDAPAALTVADDGTWGAGAWSSGVWAFGPNGEVRSLLNDRAYALAFFGGRHDLAAATSTVVFSIADVGGSAAVSSLYTAPDSLTPAGLGISSDNNEVVLADQRGSISTIYISNGATSTIACNCAPEGVLSMGGSLFRITALTGSVFRVFDARAGSVFQIPLGPGLQASPATRVPSSGLMIQSLPGGAR